MSLYSTISPPVKTNEVVSAVAALLSGGAGKPSDLSIYEHRQPLGVSGSWAIVRELNEPGGRYEADNRVDVVPIQVQFEISEDYRSDPDSWLQDAHAWAFDLLVGQEPSFSSGTAANKIQRQNRPTRPEFDHDTHTYWSVAMFLCPVKP